LIRAAGLQRDRGKAMTERTIDNRAGYRRGHRHDPLSPARIGLIQKAQRVFNGWRRYPERTLQLLHAVPAAGMATRFPPARLGDFFNQSSVVRPVPRRFARRAARTDAIERVLRGS